MTATRHFSSYLAQFFLELKKVFQAESLEKIKTQMLYSITHFRKSCPFVR